MTWKNRVGAELDGDFLKCPECGDTYMHQGNVTVYVRNEDADWTTVIAQNGENVVATKFPSADTHNPSSRRHGLTIELWCENCNSGKSDKPFYLAIQQHKGCTYVEWVS